MNPWGPELGGIVAPEKRTVQPGGQTPWRPLHAAQPPWWQRAGPATSPSGDRAATHGPSVAASRWRPRVQGLIRLTRTGHETPQSYLGGSVNPLIPSLMRGPRRHPDSLEDWLGSPTWHKLAGVSRWRGGALRQRTEG